MTLQNISVFLLAYFFVSSLISLPLVSGEERRSGAVLFSFSLVGLILTVVVGSLLHDNENFIIGTLARLAALSRQEIAAFLLGASGALPLAIAWRDASRSSSRWLPVSLAVCGLFGTLLFGVLIAGREVISPYLPHPDTQLDTGQLGRLVPEGFIVEDFVDTAIIPVRVSVSPSGRVYVSGHLGIAAQEGGVVELRAAVDGTVKETLVARMLNRPYGLLARDDALFVSRSGQYARWTNGVAEQISTGAVTMLKDVDGDGIMDYYHDVVSGLPGAKGPDYLHQNNAVVMGDEGELYITTANNSDAHPASDELEGVILRASGPEFGNVEVYASGLRNPFGLALDATGKLFATDNDSQTGLLGGDLGDKILQVTEGAFFGHPFAQDDASGVTAPLLRSKFALGGLTFADSDRLPDAYRDKLFVVVYGEGRIMQIELENDGGVRLLPFAVVPGAVDVAAAPDGSFYVAVYPDKVVRIRPQGGAT